MTESTPDQPTHETLLREARLRLSESLGGRWAVYGTLLANTEAAPAASAATPADQRQFRAEAAQNEQRLVELGMLAAGNAPEKLPYFVR